ncbi:hypothetical protein [Neorhizobium sp. AL 9.2.2]|uniref:hypothetical protein n=1 Tax=Neorhizobium sp. AL 9.2.2 TaxID=2712894 RepID=UPI001573D621|nr:hypothetical protein [Neorhizobium sp. AL 9.2.2]NSY17249.1 hypothetical protein [Neorhizobium sp. AL 9.2.2]
MKIALYIEDGLEQIVLTSESKTEEAILGRLHDGSREVSIHQGAFYAACRGGWVREFKDDKSTMIVLRPAPPATEGANAEASPTVFCDSNGIREAIERSKLSREPGSVTWVEPD